MHVLDPAWQTITKAFDAAQKESGESARAALARDLNQLLRRLQAYNSEAEWSTAVLDGASHFASQSALFSFRDGRLRLLGERNLEVSPDAEFPAASTGAFSNAIGAKEPVISLRTISEVGEALASPVRAQRAHILPILNGPRVVAVLFSSGEPSPDANALELIGGMASIVLERRSNNTLHMQIAPPATAAPTLPSWGDLDETERKLHLQAQRFARVKVAEMQLYKPDECRAGREQSNLYVFVRAEIEAAREAYRKQFMSSPSMVDYLHLELVRTAADGDELKLGADYPGPQCRRRKRLVARQSSVNCRTGGSARRCGDGEVGRSRAKWSVGRSGQ